MLLFSRNRSYIFLVAGIFLFLFLAIRKRSYRYAYVVDPFQSSHGSDGTGDNFLPGSSGDPNFTPIDDNTNDNANDSDQNGEEGTADRVQWNKLMPNYPVQNMHQLPKGSPQWLPKVQKFFDKESAVDRQVRFERRDAVKKAFQRCWNSYRKHAWMSDEIKPISGGKSDVFGGWGATLVDSLDTLWIMGLKDEFNEAVEAASKIDLSKAPKDKVNVFETNIRYLGGFLAAYDLSGDRRLLRKATEVGEMLYVAFDTPNRMPMTRWDAVAASRNELQTADESVLLAEIGTFSLEFARLSLLTKDPKWFDAANRITELLFKQQDSTRLPGMWPVIVNARTTEFNLHNDFTIGAMADSWYEYLPKTHALLGGLVPSYAEMYGKAMDAVIKRNVFRPMLPDNADILVSGLVSVSRSGDNTVYSLKPEGQHLVCFAGGMLALGGKLIENQTHVSVGEKLMDGCVWAYMNMPVGIMPETFTMLPCPLSTSPEKPSCEFSKSKWKSAVQKQLEAPKDISFAALNTLIAEKHIPKGFTSLPDTRYILRPEAIESVFILYRTTGRKDLPAKAWKMFKAIESHTKTELANAALSDITRYDPDNEDESKRYPEKTDSMESFWLGETLKYFYLMFSEPDLISLDEWVFNTEAHPLRRLVPDLKGLFD
ncbi:family 47 putative glycoside hydrolase [Triangularia setosa]|uniref:alpha-1,2-Mannosidase n=1 Tax=Triangularia setosa TaxID=2587417 RepID=A0AAN6W3R0_9PEZI|nr:family 47 putative glycoside hydrolase [Podospora setosa]